MRPLEKAVCIVLTLFITPAAAMGGPEQWRDPPLSSVTITVLYDNNPFVPGLRREWGFSALVESEGRSILFDTGGDGKTLLHNMKKLGKDPGAVGTVVISHGHGDHTGGLDSIVEVATRPRVFLPGSLPQGYSEALRVRGADVARVSGPTRILAGVYSTGEMGEIIPEQALILSTKPGLVVITGCAHPGIVSMVRRAKALLKRKVFLVMGGFHLLSSSPGRIESVVEDFRQMGVQKVAPCHCTGDEARRLFEHAYLGDFIRAGVGRAIEIR
ncbi:MAG: MBL fold metallo-hydrolase [Deltaproteobacteria bacterium]|nr:MBL fold metallo-hydrolase [Deltaproteobacteria bacterium]MBW2122785.1 MBL fold metallo-hydrolase [Deltaproteobacteria bacterium]